MLVDKCAAELGLPSSYLHDLANQGNFLYRQFSIPKRSGGTRTIHHPTPELKLVQRWVASYVGASCPVHDAAFAYRTGRNIKDHALAHTGAHYLLRIDLQDFFPSISISDVRAMLTTVEGLTDSDVEWCARIVCRNQRLTIGAPSSPAVSNAVCLRLDAALDGEARRVGARYTRYADDLYFSTTEGRILGQLERDARVLIRSLNVPSHLRVNHEKTTHSSRRGRMTVTGLVLKPGGGVSVGRKRKRSVRAQVHSMGALDPPQRAALSGYLAFLKDVEPGFVDRLYVHFGHEIMDRALGGRD